MDIVNEDQSTAEFFMSIGMHCIGCAASAYETVDQACAVHGIDTDKVVNALNDYFASKK